MVTAGGQTLNGESWVKINKASSVTQTMVYRNTRWRASTASEANGVTGTLTPNAYILVLSENGGSGSIGSLPNTREGLFFPAVLAKR